MSTPEDVLSFWFGEREPGGGIKPEVRKRWFTKDPSFDQKIGESFGALCERALAGELRGWEDSARSRLALILVLDQFTRNIYRGEPRAFAGDLRAVAVTIDGLERGFDEKLAVEERVFFYMPLMHSEQLAHQEQCVAVFEDLAAKHPEAASNVDYARRHRDIVADWGRFPHRNEVLGRTSTDAELRFLKTRGSSF